MKTGHKILCSRINAVYCAKYVTHKYSLGKIAETMNVETHGACRYRSPLDG
jgi:predicted DNA-binding protein YlxM (UPF0122 family)